jgi:nitrate/nitrite-specific signal transduction histidine kinase
MRMFWDRIGKSVTHFLLGIVGLALITFAAVLLHLQPGAISLLYLIVVVFVSLRAGFVSSVAVSVVAVVCLHYYFLPLFSVRTRIARELHDTLLQSFQGLMLHFQAVNDQLPPGKAKEALERALDRADHAIVEGRDAIQNLRSSTTVTNELGQAMAAIGEEFGGARDGKNGSPTLRVSIEGTPRELHPILRDDIYRIAREALRNAFLHSQAAKIEADITYGASLLRLRIRDDGTGIDPKLLKAGRDGHWGLRGMRERAEQIGGRLEIWSEGGAGTEVDLSVPGSIAYGAERGTR